jgi:signal transduction histidine kinase
VRFACLTIISEQGHENQLDEVLEFINMIHKSGRSILELADEILGNEPKQLKSDEFNLLLFKDKLEKLYQPQARNKNIKFQVNVTPEKGLIPFSKNKLLQIVGNVISNAIKFTPATGAVTVDMDIEEPADMLKITIADTGVGLTKASIDKILNGNALSTSGTAGEQGYGFGLSLVKHLTESLRGTLAITSEPGQGASFELTLPLTR